MCRFDRLGFLNHRFSAPRIQSGHSLLEQATYHPFNEIRGVLGIGFTHRQMSVKSVSIQTPFWQSSSAVCIFNALTHVGVHIGLFSLVIDVSFGYYECYKVSSLGYKPGSIVKTAFT